jgi:hypothetical protein
MSFIEQLSNSTCLEPGSGSMCSSVGHGHETLESLIERGVVAVTGALPIYCEKVVQTDQWCGGLAGSGTSPGVRDKCSSLEDKIMHHTGTGTIFRCAFDAEKGCRADVLPSSDDRNAGVLEVVKACTGGGERPMTGE